MQRGTLQMQRGFSVLQCASDGMQLEKSAVHSPVEGVQNCNEGMQSGTEGMQPDVAWVQTYDAANYGDGEGTTDGPEGLVFRFRCQARAVSTNVRETGSHIGHVN